MNPDSNTPAATTPASSSATPAPAASTSSTTPVASSNQPTKGQKVFGHKKGKFGGNAPKL